MAANGVERTHADDTTIRITRDGPAVTVTLDRPDVRNAFNPTMIGELTEAFLTLGSDPDVRVVVLAGAGEVFSAGADLTWMRSMTDRTLDENVADAARLADLFAALRDCPRPTVARVQRAAMGGGVGLVAACDIAVAAEGTLFAFSEVRLGLVPAVISPFVLPRIGVAAARELFLTGERFDADRAKAIGLVAHVVPPDQLDDAVDERVAALLDGGPEAQAAVKQLVPAVAAHPENVRDLTTRLIAERRASEEGQEGMAAFLERRRPRWQPNTQ